MVLCPACEERELTRVDDEAWLCFGCGHQEVMTVESRGWFLARRGTACRARAKGAQRTA